MSEERWLPVVGAEGEYEVSDLGRVRSLRRKIPKTSRWGTPMLYTVPEKVLRPRVNRRDGHMSVQIGEGNSQYVHVLVLSAFVSPRSGDMKTRHLDGDPANNKLSNLAWGTHSENMRDIDRHGKRWNAVLSREDVKTVRRRLALGFGLTEVARSLGVSIGCIAKIRAGLSHRDVM